MFIKKVKLAVVIIVLITSALFIAIYINRYLYRSKAADNNTPVITRSLGVGECHSVADLTKPSVKWAYPSSWNEVFWSTLEPKKGEYNFQSIDLMINRARAAGKKIWLQVLVSNPDSPDQYPSIPQWALDEGVRAKNPGVPVQWDSKYLQYHEKILQALAARYEKPEYYDVIEAILMMSGGHYGEMALNGQYCVGDPSIPTGKKADAEDPDNYWVKEMARTMLGSVDRSSEIATRDSQGWAFDTYYIQAVKNIVDLYARTFHVYPFVLQTGYGISCQTRVAREAADYGIEKYGNHFWLKSNGWGSFTGLGTGDANVVDPFFNQYKSQTVINYEVGHPGYFCAASDGYTFGNCYDCCRWNTHEEVLKHNQNAINYAVNSGAASICFSPLFFTNPNKYPIDMNLLQTRLADNLNPQAANLTPFPTVEHSSSSSSSSSHSSASSSSNSSSSQASSSSSTSHASNSSFSSSSSASNSSSAQSSSSSSVSSQSSSSVQQYVKIILKVKFKMQGVLNWIANQTVSTKFKILKNEVEISQTANSFNASLSSDLFWHGEIEQQIVPSSDYIFLIKPNKHLQRKVCSASPRDTSVLYSCGQNKITISSTTTDIDLTGITFFAGDITDRYQGLPDGIIDTSDYSMIQNIIRDNLGKDPAKISKADLNYDGIVDTQDASLIIEVWQKGINQDEK